MILTASPQPLVSKKAIKIDMRIWDVEPQILCRNHLLGEHRELHALWTVLTENKKGYSRHPETLRWVGKLKALYNRHTQLVKEMKRRGYNHKSNLDLQLARGKSVQDFFINTHEEQMKILKGKNCECEI
jgi:hypothetical protein